MTKHVPSVGKLDATLQWCPCHGFGAFEVLEALHAGAETVAQVFRHIGVCAKCGECVPGIRDALRNARGRHPRPIDSAKERTMHKNTKVKIAIMLEDGDKLEYEAHVEETALEAAKAEAERRLKSVLAALHARGDSITADRVKIETR